MTMSAKIWLILPLFSLALTACASTNATQHRREAGIALEAGNYKLALDEATLALEERPDSAELQRFTREVKILYLLDMQRAEVFNRRELVALKILAEVLTLEPDNRIAKLWRKKARSQLGARLINQGLDALAGERLEEAVAKLQQGLEFLPGDKRAIEGLREVTRLYEDNREHARRHYHLALGARDLSDWPRTGYHAGTAARSDPSDRDAPQLEQNATRRVVGEREAWARQLESAGLWGAAAREFAKVAELASLAKLPNADALAAKAKRAAKEAEAEEIFGKAGYAIAKRDFAEARRLAIKADSLTQLNRVKLNELLAEINEAEVRHAYRNAEIQELDYRYEEALESYKKLAKRDPDGVASTKVESIEALLKSVAELYAEAEKAVASKKPDDAAGLWKQILAVHPRYKDVAARLAEHQGAKSGRGK